jgi:AraC-like DNA-binding protein
VDVARELPFVASGTEAIEMQPTFYPPLGALARFVQYFWTFEWSQVDADRPLKMFATGVSGILLQHHEGRPALGAPAHGHPMTRGGCPTSFVYGKRTRPSQTFANGPFALTGVVFKPQGLCALLNIHPTEFNDGSVVLNDFSKENIGDQLLNARGQDERVARLSDFLCARVDRSGREDVLVTESLHLIRRELRSIRVPQLLKCLNVSERQFERRFTRAIGVTPHRYIRIVRFRKAMQLMATARFDRLSDVAYDLSYVDQSHFIKDVKAFSGCTPKRLRQLVQAGVNLPCALILPRSHTASTDADALLRSSQARRPALRSSPAVHQSLIPGKSPVGIRAVSWCGGSQSRTTSPHTEG